MRLNYRLEASRLIARSRDIRQSKNERNGCITRVRQLERESGLSLY